MPPTETQHERIEHQENLPLRAFVHSVRSCASHCHRDCEFLLILKGQIQVQNGQGHHLLRTDDVFFIHGGEVHLTHETPLVNLLVALQIDMNFAARLDPDFPRRRFEFNRLAQRDPQDRRVRLARSIVAEILWEMRLRKPGYRFQVESLLLRLLGMLAREVPSVLTEPPKSGSATDAESESALGERLARLVTYIEAHYGEEISSAQLAASEGVSLSYLARLFKERLGCTFGEYVSMIRAKKSLPLLARKSATILDVALECGFPNVKSYNIVFKRLNGMTPSAWRKTNRSDVPGLGESAYNRCDTDFAYHLLKRHLREGFSSS